MGRLIFLFGLLLFSCQEKVSEKTLERWKQEIINTESDFCDLAQKEGIKNAFLQYAAQDAVLQRNNQLIKGKDSIKDFMKNSTSKGLSWKPDFVDVSKSGDLGYTYGRYKFVFQDSLGNRKSSEGIFHTVWKRQPDNSWKFVWD